IRSAKKLTAMGSTSTTSRHATRGVSFREFVFQLSREFTSKESLASDQKLTFTFRIKTSKSPGSQSKRRSSRSLRLGDGRVGLAISPKRAFNRSSLLKQLCLGCRNRRGGATRRRFHCAPWVRDRATDTFPRVHPLH